MLLRHLRHVVTDGAAIGRDHCAASLQQLDVSHDQTLVETAHNVGAALVIRRVDDAQRDMHLVRQTRTPLGARQRTRVTTAGSVQTQGFSVQSYLTTV